MIKGKKVLAIIPARGGSKGVPSKNIKDLGGKPLIAWTIEAAKSVKEIDSVIVSSDSELIISVAKKHGAEVPFKRPEELATDGAKSIDVINHAMDFFEGKYDIVVVLQPTSPLRSAHHVRSALKDFMNREAKAMVSVCEVEHPVQWSGTLGENKSMKNFIKEEFQNVNRQDLEKHYRLSGAIYIGYADYVKEKGSFISDDTCAFVMSKETSVDIDNIVDFKLAEVLEAEREVRDIKNIIIDKNKTIKDALKQIDKGAERNVFVVEEDNTLVGTISDGDIRRWILSNGKLSDSLMKVCNTSPKYLYEGSGLSVARVMMIENSVDVLPILDEEKRMIDVIKWKDLFSNNGKKQFQQIDLPVVIMAGGMGTRLKPFTDILPKPLIPMGDKAMIELIMDEYAKFGMTDFHVSINHKGKMIQAYFQEHQSNYTFDYIKEDTPLGTAGALKFLEGKIDTPLFVSNCDVLIKSDYSKIYNFHKEGGYALTLVAALQHHTIPYGVCEIKEGGKLADLQEKPEFDYLANAGMYILQPEVLKFIPEGEFFHITHLMEKLKEEGLEVGVYPVSESSWIDVGQWKEYAKSQDFLNHL